MVNLLFICCLLVQRKRDSNVAFWAVVNLFVKVEGVGFSIYYTIAQKSSQERYGDSKVLKIGLSMVAVQPLSCSWIGFPPP